MPPSIIPPNAVKRLLHGGGSAVGLMLVEIRQPSVMQVLANAGFQFVLIDGEHGPFGIETIADLSRAARSAGMTPIVRVPDTTYAYVTQPLDAGAQGVMIPRITSPDQVRAAVEWINYPPAGRRGVVVARGHTDFRSGALPEATADSNRETMLVVQVETRQALENLDAILSVPGVDVALIGPTDLSVALGVPGSLEDPGLVSAIEQTIRASIAHNVVPAIHANDLAFAARWAGRGMRMVSFNSELGLITKAGSEAVAAVAAAFRKQS